MTAKPMHGDGAAPLLAGIDLGTLTCRLLVARVGDGDGLPPVHRAYCWSWPHASRQVEAQVEVKGKSEHGNPESGPQPKPQP